jgi:hypothetical protein
VSLFCNSCFSHIFVIFILIIPYEGITCFSQYQLLLIPQTSHMGVFYFRIQQFSLKSLRLGSVSRHGFNHVLLAGAKFKGGLGG